MMTTDKFKSAAKQFKGSLKLINELGFNGGFSSFKSMLMQFANIETALSPFKIVLSLIQAQTTEDAMKLFEANMELIQSEGFQSGIEVLTSFINSIVGEQFVSGINALNNIINTFSTDGEGIGKFLASFILLDDFLVLFSETLDRIVGKKDWKGLDEFIKKISIIDDIFDGIARKLGYMDQSGSGGDDIYDPDPDIDTDIPVQHWH